MRRPGTLRGYQPTDYFAWSGWRYRIPGGPAGGQYHGFIGPDSSFEGWPGGRSEIATGGQIHPAGKSLLPGEGSSKGPWDKNWGGTAFGEGQTHSDYVYRSPAEMRPRPNASGGTNVIHGHQTRRSAGYAVAPGNYRSLGGLGAVMYDGAAYYPYTVLRPVGPAWTVPAAGSGATTTVTQPGPPGTPAPAPTVPTAVYPIQYLGPPVQAPPISPAPAPVVSVSPSAYLPSQGLIVPGITPGYGPIDQPPAPCPSGYIASGPSGSCMPTGPIPCPTGYTEDPTSGQCVVPASATPAAAAPGTFSSWLAEDTVISGISNQTTLLLGLLGAAILFSGRGKR